MRVADEAELAWTRPKGNKPGFSAPVGKTHAEPTKEDEIHEENIEGLALKAPLVPEVETTYNMIRYICEEYEKGLISDDDFRVRFSDYMHLMTTPEELAYMARVLIEADPL